MKKIDLIIPCYNPGKELINVLESASNQVVNNNWKISIILVNDASSDIKYIERVRENYPAVSIINLEKNTGRSGACDYGAKYSNAEILVFIDADCVFKNKYMIEDHRYNICNGNNVNFGKVDVKNRGNIFWDKYFKLISKKRDVQATSKNFMELTSANMGISKESYINVYGFDSDYKHYGFEDRDLIYKLIISEKNIHYSPSNVVYHKSDLSLVSICKKMMTAGQYTSGVFFNKHPLAYEKMSYSKIDVCLNSLLKLPINILWLLFNRSVGVMDSLLSVPYVPFHIKRYIVLAFSTLYFSKGTLRRCKRLNN